MLKVVKLPEGHRSMTNACLTTILHQNPSVGTPNTKVPVDIVRSQNPEFWHWRRRELLIEEKSWKFQVGRYKKRRDTQDNAAKVRKIAVAIECILAKSSYGCSDGTCLNYWSSSLSEERDLKNDDLGDSDLRISPLSGRDQVPCNYRQKAKFKNLSL